MTKAKVITIGLLALFVLALLCAQRAVSPSGSSVAASESTAKLGLSMEDGKVVLRGGVPDATLKQQLVAKAYQVFGAGNVVNHLTIEPQAKSEDWLPRAAELIVRMKSWGSGGVTFDGRRAVVTGEVKDEGEKSKRQEELLALLGATTKVESQLLVRASPSKSDPAKPDLDKSSPLLTKIHDALAGKSIDFEIGSATLTSQAMKVLDHIVPLIRVDKDVKVEIGGHTDNYGDPKFNQLVSQARAVSVAQYLIAKGVDSHQLISKGYGDSRPIASNKTRDGRQKNRRVTFQAP